jgi:hypothetical protein
LSFQQLAELATTFEETAEKAQNEFAEELFFYKFLSKKSARYKQMKKYPNFTSTDKIGSIRIQQ